MRCRVLPLFGGIEPLAMCLVLFHGLTVPVRWREQWPCAWSAAEQGIRFSKEGYAYGYPFVRT